MRLEPASAWSYAELAEIFNAGYEGYFTPFNLDEAAFRFMSTTWDDDLDASRVAVVDGEPAGICKLAIRGERGWIAGVGVAPPHRGAGIGEALMRAVLEEARTRGLREVSLEVLVQNEPAIRLYEKLGFANGARARGLDARPARSRRARRLRRSGGAGARADSRAVAPGANRGSARTSRLPITRASKGSRASAVPSSSAARAIASRCCRASRRTRTLPASCSRVSVPRRRRFSG